MNTRDLVHRRSLLKALGLAPALVPLLDAEVARAATPKPKRFIVIAVPNGVREDVYWPRGTETSWTIGADAPLAPLIPHQKDIIFLGGIKLQNGADALGTLGGHGCLPFLLTGGRGAPGPTIGDGVKLSASNPSVDVYIAKQLGKRVDLRFESLALVPWRHEGYNDGYLSFYGPAIGGAIPNVPTQRHDPIALFDDLFGGGNDATTAKLRAQRKSVLDFTGSYLSYMAKSLGTEDRRRLDAHAEGVRRIEKQLAPGPTGCTKPTLGDPKTLDSSITSANPNVANIVKAHIDLTVAAMACDVTRVASMLWGDSGNVRWVWSWLGPEFTKPGRDFANNGENKGLRNDHEIAHRDGEAEFTPLKNRATQWYMEQLAYLIAALKATPDAGGGSLFDSTAILFVNMQRSGGGHQTDNLPWIIAGSAGGYFKTGRFLPWPSGTEGTNIPHNPILAAMCNAMDCPVEWYGEKDYGGELTLLKG